jgi:uncharacterized membrane protein (DUF4010 family)
VPLELVIPVRLALAGLAGLAVGIEREWSGHATGPGARFAGVRTFLLLGLLGGVAGWLISERLVPVASVLLAGGAALAIVAYVTASRASGNPDGTTEAAALLVLAVGALCGMGHGRLGSGIAAVAVVALAEKSRIQGLVRRIGEVELRGALQFAVLALVVLPLLPTGPYGPYDAIRPRDLWTVVLIFSGLNFLGYIASRAIGRERGYGVAGLLGGMVSSTAVTFTFSRESRRSPADAGPLGLGIVAACTVLLARVLVVTAVLNPAVAARLAPYLVAPAVVGGAFATWALLRTTPAGADDPGPDRSPLRLGSAIQMAIAFQLVLLVVPYAEHLGGSSGVLGSAAILGLTDMDALTFAMSRVGAAESGPALAARAIAIGILSNTVLKLGATLVLGSPGLRRTASAGLAALVLATAGAIVWLR